MSAAETDQVSIALPDFIDLAALHHSLIVSLGQLNQPASVTTIVEGLPEPYQDSFHLHVQHLEYPGKLGHHPEGAFMDTYLWASIEYVYQPEKGYQLVRPYGWKIFCEIIANDEQATRYLPNAKPATNRRLGCMAVDPYPALRSA